MTSFDPNAAAGADSGIFGLPHSPKDAALALIPVPWEATTSYGGGTAQGPQAILEASKQVDLFDLETGKPYEAGIHMLEQSKEVLDWNIHAKELAEKGAPEAIIEVNRLSRKVNDFVYAQAKSLFDGGSLVGLVGGDHSTPYGLLRAVGERYGSFGILHIDAHADLRVAFEGFEHSHASIMYNVIKDIPQVSKLVQVGIRDFCEQEYDLIAGSKGRIRTYFDQHLAQQKLNGQNWSKITQQIVSELPDQVHISFDIDGLDPSLCPNTGTPVPGGLSYHEVTSLIAQVVHSGRRVISFDLSEVAPGRGGEQWNANVGARILYKLCGWTLVSQGLCEKQNRL